MMPRVRCCRYPCEVPGRVGRSKGPLCAVCTQAPVNQDVAADTPRYEFPPCTRNDIRLASLLTWYELTLLPLRAQYRAVAGSDLEADYGPPSP